VSPQSLKALKMLELDPTLRRAVVIDTDSIHAAAIVAVAVRGIGVGEVLISRNRYDGVALLALLEPVSSVSSVPSGKIVSGTADNSNAYARASRGASLT
jgi:hypothetical protein